MLILRMGVTGAALATFISYLVVFTMRLINTRSLLAMRFSPGHLLVNTCLLIAEASLMILEVKWWPLWCGICAAVVLVLNFASLWKMARQLLGRFVRRRKRA